MHTLERFQGKGRAVLTASDATQYAFEGNDVTGSARPGLLAGLLRRPERHLRRRPGVCWLVVGCLLVVRAGVAAGTRTPLVAGRPSLSRDRRIGCAVVVLVAAVAMVRAQPEVEDVWACLQLNSNVLVLAPAGLAITLLCLRHGQQLAALVTGGLFALWSVHFPLSELVDPVLGFEPPVWITEIVWPAVVLLARGVAQLVPRAGAEEAAAAASGRR